MVAFELLLWNGIVAGSIIAVAALGLTLIFGVLNFINVAYGEYIALGAYFAYLGKVELGLPLYVGALIGVVGAAIVALLSHWAVFKRFDAKPPIILLIVSIGLSIILRNLIMLNWGGSSLGYERPIEQANQYFGVFVLPVEMVIVVVSVVLLLGTYLLLKRTMVGIGMRGASDNMDLAKIRGINTRRLVIYVWLVAGATAGTSGILLGLHSQIQPLMGFHLLVALFAAVILGGIGDPIGAVVSGYAIGLSQELSLLVLPSEYKTVVALLILVIGLLARPQGLFGEATR